MMKNQYKNIPILIYLLIVLLGCSESNPTSDNDFKQINTWENISYNLPQNKYYSCSIIDEKLFVFADKELFYSINNGDSWEKINASIPDSIRIISMTGDNGILAVATIENGAFISKDLGLTWYEPQNEGLDNDANYVNSIKMISGLIYIGASTDAKVYRTGNFGDSWESFSNGLPTTTSIFYPRINLLSEYDDKIFAAPFASGIYTTNKNINNWRSFNEGFPVQSTVWSLAVSDSFYFVTVEAESFKEIGLYRRTFNGTQWKKIPVKIEDSGPHFVVAKDRTVLVSTDTQIEISFDNGMTWNNCYKGLESIEYPYFYNAFIHNDYVFTFNNNRSIWRYSLK